MDGVISHVAEACAPPFLMGVELSELQACIEGKRENINAIAYEAQTLQLQVARNHVT